MSDKPELKTFDLVGFLAGRDLPTQEVRASFDEGTNLEILKLKQKLESAPVDETEAIEDELQKLSKKVFDESLVFTLRAVLEHVRRDILQKVQEEFPSKKDIFGQEQVTPGADDAFTLRMWAAYIQTVTPPGGTPSPISYEAVEALYNTAPASVHEAINKGIAELQVGPKAGYEIAAQEIDFLSSASTED